MSRFSIKDLLPANFNMPVANKEEGYLNIDRFCNYSMIIGILAHTPSLFIMVDAFPTVIGHRIIDVIYTTISNIAPRRIKDSKEMGIHPNSSGMQPWYYILKNCERLQYVHTNFRHNSDLNNIDNIINGIVNMKIDEVLQTYFPSKFLPSVLTNVEAMPTKILAFNDKAAVDKEFPFTLETRQVGYSGVDRAIMVMEKQIDGGEEDTGEEKPKSKIEISSH